MPETNTTTNTTNTAPNAGRPAKKKKSGGVAAALLLIIAVIAVIVLGTSLVVTQENEYTLVKQFGKIDHVIDKAGLSFKIPFIQSTDTLPKEILLYDLAASDVITMDKKTMVADSYVLWRIVDPQLFVQTLNSQVSNAESRINAVVFMSMKNIISSLEQAEVISGRDGELTKMIMANIGDSMEQYGIELINVEIKRLDLPDDNKNAVYERMISERNNTAASFTAEGEAEAKKIRTQTDYEISISISEAKAEAAAIVAEGEAEYMRILSEVYADQDRSDFYTFVLALDAAKASLTGDNKTLILDEDSPIAQIFNHIE
ncbi:MAG: protease modulator HflC [Lachnospiraceae bacterium]|nr:protease modulator HflC [Lachnospiraceae bacterium]MBP3611533.1 protease modulator HflC [Lachnospiraceae bacterium]